MSLEFLRLVISCHIPRTSPEAFVISSICWALEYHTLITFFLREPLRNKSVSVYFFLPGYLKAQFRKKHLETTGVRPGASGAFSCGLKLTLLGGAGELVRVLKGHLKWIYGVP